MAETLEAWLARKLKTVEEDGKSTASITLQAGDGGQVWDRWDKPLREEEGGPGPHGLASLIEELLSGYAEEWPEKKMHQVMLTALDGNGADCGRWTKAVKGKSKSAAVTMLASESVQHASAMQVHAETTKTLLGSANNQIQLQQRTIEMLLTNLTGTMELMVNDKLKQTLEADQQGTEIQKEMWETLKQSSPQVLEMLGHLLMKSKGQ